jgi:O-antigen/teichoic acid export membrane protein
MKSLGAGIALAYNIILARTLGADVVGIYFLALTATIIASVVGRLGFENTMLRFIAANAEVMNWGAVRSIYQLGTRITFLTSIVIAFLLFIAAPWLCIVIFEKPELIEPMRWMSFAVVPLAQLNLLAASLRGLKRIRDSQLVKIIGVPSFALIGFVFLGRYWSIMGAVWAYVTGAGFTAVLGWSLWHHFTSHLENVKTKIDKKEIFSSSIPLFFVSIIEMSRKWIPTIFLGILANNIDVAVFNIGFRIAMLTSFALMSVNTIAAPKFAALYKKGKIDELGKTARFSAKLAMYITVPIFAIFIIFPDEIMALFGKEFGNGSIVLIILVIGEFINVMTGSVQYLLMMSGNEQLVLKLNILSVSLTLGLNVLLIPVYGVLGAAIATSTTVIVKNLISIIAVYKYLGITILTMPRLRFNKKG